MAKVLIDANNYLKRAYHGGGDPYALWFGLMNKYVSEDVEVVCDTGTSRKYRKEIFPDYKKGRKSGDDPIYWELYNNCIDIATFYAKTTVIKVTYGEADDYIMSNANRGDIVISNDKDLWPLVGKDVTVLINATTKVDRDLIQIKFLQPNPDYIVVYKALVGDPSDNIKGRRGFGVKAYEKLTIEELDHLKDCLENILYNTLIDESVKMSFKLASPYKGYKIEIYPVQSIATLQEFCKNKGILC